MWLRTWVLLFFSRKIYLEILGNPLKTPKMSLLLGDFRDALPRDQERCIIVFGKQKHWPGAETDRQTSLQAGFNFVPVGDAVVRLLNGLTPQ